MRPVPFVLGLALCAACAASPSPSGGSREPGADPGGDPSDPGDPVGDPVDEPGDDPVDPIVTWTPPHEDDQQAPLGAPTVTRPALALSGDATDGAPMVLDASGQVAFVADLDLGAVLRVDLRDEAAAVVPTVVPVGAEPTRLLRVGDALFVTLRGAGEVVRLDVSGPAPVVVDRVTVGAEPTDLVISRDLARLYVTLSQEEAVVALDAPTLAPIGRFSVLGEPKWLALRGDGVDERVVVASARLPRLREIDPLTGALTTTPLPVLPRFTDPDCPQRDLAARVTGDPTVDATDGSLLVPLLLVDLQIEEPDGFVFGGVDTGGDVRPDTFDPGFHTGDTGSVAASTGGSTPGSGSPAGIPGVCEDGRPPAGSGPYGRPADPISPGRPGRFTPGIGVWTPGVPTPTVLAVGTQVPHVQGAVVVARSYPSSVVATPDALLVTMPGSGALAVLQRGVPQVTGADAPLLSLQRKAVDVGDGLDAVQVAADGRLVAWAFVERTVRVGAGPGTLPTVVMAPASSLSLRLQLGRQMFYSADDAAMSAPGSGVSCETCHTDGRSAAQTFVFPDLPRQPPSIAGHVSDTTPITWLGTVDTVVDEVNATSRDRMGGQGPTLDQAEAIAAYVDSIRLPIRPTLPPDAVARGAALFGRPDVGCAGCHAGDARTDGENWFVLGNTVALNTPSLRGVGGSAPYFHDGSAFTLRDVLERAKDRSMGYTGGLSDAELDDLETYLLSL